MQSRPKTFLTFSLFCLLPLLVISSFGFFINLRADRTSLGADLRRDLEGISTDFESLLNARETELLALADDKAIRNYLHAETIQTASQSSQTPGSLSSAAPASNQEPQDVRNTVAALIPGQHFYTAIAVFASDKHLVFLAESPRTPEGEPNFRTNDLFPDQFRPPESVWTSNERQPICTIVHKPTSGGTMRCSTPILDSQGVRGAVVADINLDTIIHLLASRASSRLRGTPPSTMVVVLDDSGSIVYHTNDALKYQPARISMPYFSPIAWAMINGQSGSHFYQSTEGDWWLAAYGPLGQGLSLAVARNYSLATSTTRRYGWLNIILALIVGLAATTLLTRYYLRKTQSIDRVAEGVGAIAKGQLDHRIDLLSSDDLRPLADNLGLMSKQLREQISREEESRQFQSFVRLSAVLTHDLKNAIEAVSLTVTNMERHFDNAEFRADAMKTLLGATVKLKSLVARLSQPVSTLSGEHKRPTPVDLVPMLRRVISHTADQAAEKHEIKINLPKALQAMVDIERMEKVAENLVINALESMTGKPGVLTIEGGVTDTGKTFFSVTDTGVGMSRRFIEERLFHPFATTKRTGVGLGLYTCREVVKANAGSMEVDSEQGVGTTFRVVLPSVATNSSSGEIKPRKQPHK